MRTIPTPEVFARHAATGLTRQSYAAVVAADAECTAAEADRALAIAEAGAVLLPYLVYPGDEAYLTPTLDALYTLCNEPLAVAECRKSGEMFPVATWLKIARQTRRHAARIRHQVALVSAQERVA